jgi:catechol-2,3-dioxygenase
MRITEIELLSNNLDSTIRFYRDLMGFEVADGSEDHVSFKAGDSLLTFVKSDIDIPVYHFAFNIPTHTLMEALDWSRKLVPIIPVNETEEIADFVSWNAKAFYFEDNNGNILEFIARYNLKDNYGGAFSAKSILSISEIAIVVDDVTETRKQFSEKYGLSVFAGTSMENFAAMGSDEGLFIISEKGREWYATPMQAESAWSRISFESAGRSYEITTE